MLLAAVIVAQLSNEQYMQIWKKPVIDCAKVGCTITRNDETANSTITAHCPPGYEFVMTNSGAKCAHDLAQPDWR